MEQKKGAGRIAKWDNARWILITLVVICHFFENYLGNPVANSLFFCRKKFIKHYKKMDCADCELFPTLTMLSLSVKGVYPFFNGFKVCRSDC